MRTLTIGACPNSRDGSQYYRMWLPFKHLYLNSLHIIGIEQPGSYPTSPDDVAGIDVLVVQKLAGSHGLRLLEQLSGHTKLVYDIDDDMLNVESAGLPHLVNERSRESIRRCLRLADMVTVSSPHLGDIVADVIGADRRADIVVLPNHVKAGLLDIVRPRRDRVTVGWAGGDTHAWDIEIVRDPLRRVMDTEDIDIHFVGANHSPVLGRPCRWTAWNEDVGHYYRNVDFDIAVAPSWDNLFNRSKTPIRALEMGALGIPVVASNRLPYSDYVIDGKTGFLCDTAADWEEAIHTLIADEAMREEMGAAGREQAAGWTVEEGWRLWESAYETIAGGKDNG